MKESWLRIKFINPRTIEGKPQTEKLHSERVTLDMERKRYTELRIQMLKRQLRSKFGLTV